MSQPTLPLMVVEWDDAHVEADVPINLDTVRDSHKPTVVTAIGWLLREDEVGVSIANEFYESCYRGRTFIPSAMIRSATRVRLSKPRVKKPQGVAVVATQEEAAE